jgi:hypothetical protein
VLPEKKGQSKKDTICIGFLFIYFRPSHVFFCFGSTKAYLHIVFLRVSVLQEDMEFKVCSFLLGGFLCLFVKNRKGPVIGGESL